MLKKNMPRRKDEVSSTSWKKEYEEFTHGWKHKSPLLRDADHRKLWFIGCDQKDVVHVYFGGIKASSLQHRVVASSPSWKKRWETKVKQGYAPWRHVSFTTPTTSSTELQKWRATLLERKHEEATELFHYQKGTSNKFWMAQRTGTEVTTLYGRVGDLRTNTPDPFPTVEKAKAYVTMKCKEKRRKGYDVVV
jgi:predicted DNA-binding WGR domain protein